MENENMRQDFHRMTDKTRMPTEEEIESFIGERAKEAWSEIRQFIKDYYNVTPRASFMEQSMDGQFVTAKVEKRCVRFSLKRADLQFL